MQFCWNIHFILYIICKYHHFTEILDKYIHIQDKAHSLIIKLIAKLICYFFILLIENVDANNGDHDSLKISTSMVPNEEILGW